MGATVWFSANKHAIPILGHSGFLEYFTTTFDGKSMSLKSILIVPSLGVKRSYGSSLYSEERKKCVQLCLQTHSDFIPQNVDWKRAPQLPDPKDRFPATPELRRVGTVSDVACLHVDHGATELLPRPMNAWHVVGIAD